MLLTHCFAVCAAGTRILFEADSSEAFDLLERHVFPSTSRELVTPGSPVDLRIRLCTSDGSCGLFVDDALVAAAATPQALLRQIIDCLDTQLVPRLKGLHAVHAGTVRVGDKALLFPGASHSGKSSLVAELLRHGAIFFSDEYALIDGEGLVHPYPRILLVRNGGSAQSPVFPESVATQPARVGWILSLQYESGGSWDISQVPQSLGLLSLLQNTPHVLAERPTMVDAFQRAVDRAACYAGRRGEAAESVDRILQLICS